MTCDQAEHSKYSQLVSDCRFCVFNEIHSAETPPAQSLLNDVSVGQQMMRMMRVWMMWMRRRLSSQFTEFRHGVQIYT